MGIYIPSYAWWLVVAAFAGYGAASWLLLTSRVASTPDGRQRLLFPLIVVGAGLGLYLLEHFYRSGFGSAPGGGDHPLSLEHLVSELAPLLLALGLAATVLRSWLGWARGLALVAAADAFILLFRPGPAVNHLFQLLAVVALLWGMRGLWLVPRAGRAATAGALALAVAGGIGTYCEIGMMFL